VSGFGTAVAEDHVVARGGRKHGGDEGSGAGDEAVDHHRFPQFRAAEHQPGDAADLEAADFGEKVDAVGGVGVVEFDSAPDHRRLVGEFLRVEPGAAPDERSRVGGAGKHGNDRRRRRRVADPHLAGGEDVGIRGERFGDADSRFERGDGLFATHGGAD